MRKNSESSQSTVISDNIRKLLKNYREGKLTEQQCISEVKNLYFEDIGFAKVDHHRSIRRGFPEVIYGQNKTPEQILEIALKILKYSDILLITRTDKTVFEYLTEKIKDIKYNDMAGLIYTPLKIREDELAKGITVVCAGTTDIPVAEEAAITAYLMGNSVARIYDVGIAGLHRLKIGRASCRERV